MNESKLKCKVLNYQITLKKMLGNVSLASRV